MEDKKHGNKQRGKQSFRSKKDDGVRSSEFGLRNSIKEERMILIFLIKIQRKAFVLYLKTLKKRELPDHRIDLKKHIRKIRKLTEVKINQALSVKKSVLQV